MATSKHTKTVLEIFKNINGKIIWTLIYLSNLHFIFVFYSKKSSYYLDIQEAI